MLLRACDRMQIELVQWLYWDARMYVLNDVKNFVGNRFAEHKSKELG